MKKLSVEEIRSLAREIVSRNPGGVRYGALRDEILKKSPNTPSNTVAGSVWDLHQQFPNEISKPSRGLYMPVGDDGTRDRTDKAKADKRPKEEGFYKSFAEWLKDEEEVTDAVALGGNRLGRKWGTPDVIGVYKPLASHRIRFNPEIVSAEIKVNPGEAVVAFGQAVAYRLFSAKTYLAMPDDLSAEDQGRLEALCMLFGVGLVLFKSDLNEPGYTIRMRAQRYSPDMFYVNDLADSLLKADPDLFQKLFG
jgi:hypothetical protein